MPNHPHISQLTGGEPAPFRMPPKMPQDVFGLSEPQKSAPTQLAPDCNRLQLGLAGQPERVLLEKGGCGGKCGGRARKHPSISAYSAPDASNGPLVPKNDFDATDNRMQPNAGWSCGLRGEQLCGLADGRSENGVFKPLSAGGAL
jgi:hypothetical protein